MVEKVGEPRLRKLGQKKEYLHSNLGKKEVNVTDTIEDNVE